MRNVPPGIYAILWSLAVTLGEASRGALVIAFSPVPTFCEHLMVYLSPHQRHTCIFITVMAAFGCWLFVSDRRPAAGDLGRDWPDA
jgi:hypothetical protein